MMERGRRSVAGWRAKEGGLKGLKGREGGFGCG